MEAIKGADIVIIGAGIAGLASAWGVARSGKRVIVVEQSPRLGSGASGAAIGALWPPSPIDRAPFAVTRRLSLETYPSFAAEIEEYSGVSTHYSRQSFIEIIRSESQYEMAKKEASARFTGEAEFSLLSANELPSFGLSPHPFGAIFCDRAATISPAAILESLFRALEKRGVRFIFGSKFLSIKTAGTRITAVELDSGILPCEIAIIAAGADISQLFPKVETISPVKGQMITLRTPNLKLKGIIRAKPYYLVQSRSNEIDVGSTTERDAGSDSSLSPKIMQQIHKGAAEIMPELSSASILGGRAGLRPMSKSRKPVVRAIEDMKGAYLVGGHYKQGMVLAPWTANRVRELIENGT